MPTGPTNVIGRWSTNTRCSTNGGKPERVVAVEVREKDGIDAPGSTPHRCMCGSSGAPPSSSRRPLTTTAPL